MSWAAPLRLAVQMGIAPEAFWRLSLAEWRLLTESPPQPVLTRSGFADLIARYPDEEPSP
jgi:hypothetical protein